MEPELTPPDMSSRDAVRHVLEAGAAVLFNDGLPRGFLDQWVDQTVLLLDLTSTRDERWAAASRQQSRRASRRG